MWDVGCVYKGGVCAYICVMGSMYSGEEDVKDARLDELEERVSGP